MGQPTILPKVKRQMKFYRWLVVEKSDDVGILQVLPAETRDEAEEMAEELGKFRGHRHFFVAEARVDDDWNLFWSGTRMGHPLESHEGVA
jgi:hypothetical protein